MTNIVNHGSIITSSLQKVHTTATQVILRIQHECGHLTNMSVAAIAKSGQLALQAAPLGLTGLDR